MRIRNFRVIAIVLGSLLCTTGLVYAAANQMQERNRVQIENRWQGAADAGQQRRYHKAARTLDSSDSRPTYYGQGYESRMAGAGRGMSTGRGKRR